MIRTLLCLVVVSACTSPSGKPSEGAALDASLAASSPAILRQRLLEIRDLARKGNADAVGKAMADFLMTEADATRLFGNAMGHRIWTGYDNEIAPSLRIEVGPTLVEQMKAGRTELDVYQVGPAFGEVTHRGDTALLEALTTPARMYSAKFRASDDKIGFRLNGFVYTGGRWICLFKSWAYMAPPDAAVDGSGASDAGAE